MPVLRIRAVGRDRIRVELEDGETAETLSTKVAAQYGSTGENPTTLRFSLNNKDWIDLAPSDPVLGASSGIRPGDLVWVRGLPELEERAPPASTERAPPASAERAPTASTERAPAPSVAAEDSADPPSLPPLLARVLSTSDPRDLQELAVAAVHASMLSLGFQSEVREMGMRAREGARFRRSE